MIRATYPYIIVLCVIISIHQSRRYVRTLFLGGLDSQPCCADTSEQLWSSLPLCIGTVKLAKPVSRHPHPLLFPELASHAGLPNK